MCINPTYIDNPYYGKNHLHYKGLRDTNSRKLAIPCKNCPECIALEQMYLVQRIQMESLNNWLFMGTVTYKNEYLPHLMTSQGYEYRYADIKDYTGMIKRLRKNNTFEFPFREFYVSERGGKGGRPHLHCILMFRKSDIGKTYEDAHNFAFVHKWDIFQEWKRVTKKGRYSTSEQLSDYRESIRNGIVHKTYDFHFVDPRLTDSGITDVAFYVLKYLMKCTPHETKIRRKLYLSYEKEEAKAYWDTIKSRKIQSKLFGLDVWKDLEDTHNYDIINWLRQGIERSKLSSPYALYYAPEQLLTFPLAPYYKENPLIYSMEDEMVFLHKDENYKKYGYRLPKQMPEVSEMIKKFNDYERKLKLLDKEVFSETLEELYD